MWSSCVIGIKGRDPAVSLGNHLSVPAIMYYLPNQGSISNCVIVSKEQTILMILVSV